MSYIKAKVHQTDMKEKMQQEVVDTCARIMCQADATPLKVANEIRRYFDEYHGPSWTCIVGRDFSRQGALLFNLGTIPYEYVQYLLLHVFVVFILVHLRMRKKGSFH